MAGPAPRRRLDPGSRPIVPRGRRSPRFAIVAARFNEPITTRLLEGARGALAEGGVPDGAIEVHWVPGSFELPLAAYHLAATGRYAGIVCLGVVIRGQTPHFDHVAREAASGIRHVALTTGVPTTFGVITALSERQALERAGGKVGNRGREAADAALEMAGFVRSVTASGRGKRSGAHGQA